jgi:hypothetical protein
MLRERGVFVDPEPGKKYGYRPMYVCSCLPSYPADSLCRDLEPKHKYTPGKNRIEEARNNTSHFEVPTYLFR